jgi:hypothetical protein
VPYLLWRLYRIEWFVRWSWWRGVKLLASVDISTHAPWITLNEQHITACTSTKLMNCTGMQDSSWARWPQMEGHWKKRKKMIVMNTLAVGKGQAEGFIKYTWTLCWTNLTTGCAVCAGRSCPSVECSPFLSPIWGLSLTAVSGQGWTVTSRQNILLT